MTDHYARLGVAGQDMAAEFLRQLEDLPETLISRP